MRSLYLFLLLLAGQYCMGQEYDFTHLNGLRDKKGNVYFNTCGYTITISSWTGDIGNPKTVNKVLRDLEVKAAKRTYSDENLDVRNRVIEVEPEQIAESPRVYTDNVLYLIQKEENRVASLTFATVAPRDTLFERVFISEWLIDGLDLFISDSPVATQVFLAGEWIQLGTACRWMGPNNVYFGGGQISWSEFPSLERAIQDRDNRIAANRESKAQQVFEEEIGVIFEGVPTLAKRVVYIPVNHTKGYVGPPLIVYYIAEEIRGHYMSCVLSNYGHNRNDYELALLLREFMTIPDLPTTARNPFDVAEYDSYIYDEIENMPDPIHLFEFGLSMWNPTGKLRDQLGTGMGFNLIVGLPIKRTMTIDLQLQGQFPFKKEPFNYHYKEGGSDETKGTSIAVLGLRLRNQHDLKKSFKLNTYFGVGVGILNTDLVDYYDDNDNEVYHTVTTVNLHAGASLRYKKGGVFLEYHYAPFSLSDRLDKEFGGSSINLGLVFCY